MVSACAPRHTTIEPVYRPSSPEVEAQARLLHDAHAVHVLGQHSKAIELYQRFIETYPASPRLSEARWWLARSYEGFGDTRTAVAQYRQLVTVDAATSDERDVYQGRAIERLEELRRTEGEALIPSSGHVAVLLRCHQLPPASGLEEWVRKLAEARVSALLLEIGSSVGPPGSSPCGSATSESDAGLTTQSGVLFQTKQAPVVEDLFAQLISLAHRQGVFVFGVLNLQRMPWWQDHSEWRGSVFEPRTRGIHPSRYLDLLNSSFQTHLGRLLRDLAILDVDGLFIQPRMKDGFAFEFSTESLRGFETRYHTSIDPTELYAGAPMGTDVTSAGSVSGSVSEPAAHQEFWRWVGWKAHEHYAVLERIKSQLQTINPRLRVILEVHSEAVMDPLRALVEYGEDVVEARRLGFDILLGGERSDGGESIQRKSPESARPNASLRHLVDVPGAPQHVWILARAEGADQIGGHLNLPERAHAIRPADGMHVLFAMGSPSHLP